MAKHKAVGNVYTLDLKDAGTVHPMHVDTAGAIGVALAEIPPGAVLIGCRFVGGEDAGYRLTFADDGGAHFQTATGNAATD